MDPTTNSLQNKSQSSQTYIVITAFLALFAVVGFGIYGLPFFFDFIMEERGWSRAVITSGNAVGKLIVAPLFGFLAGWLIDKYGPRSLMMTGALMLFIAFAGIAFSSSLEMFYVFYVFNALGYVFAGPLPSQVLISRWFDKNRGKAMGIAYLGIGTGGAVVPILAAKLVAMYDWHTALAVLGGIGFVLIFTVAFFIKDNAHKVRAAAQAEKVVAPIEGPSMKEILRSRNFYLLAIGSMCSIGVVGGISQHIKLYLKDQNFAQAEAAQVMSFVLLSSLIGRVLMGYLADVFNRKHVMLLIYLIVASAIPLLLMPDFTGRIYIFAIIFGIGLGGDYMIIPLMAGDLFGLKALGRTMGIILVADGVAEALFPVLLGLLYDEQAKSYAVGFSVLIAVALLGALFIYFLPKVDQHKGMEGMVENP